MTTFVTEDETSEHDQSFAARDGLWHESAPERLRRAYRSGELPAHVWWPLLDFLSGLRSDDVAHIQGTNDPLSWQLLCGELPLTLAYLFPEIEHCRSTIQPAKQCLADGLSELVDNDGLPS